MKKSDTKTDIKKLTAVKSVTEKFIKNLEEAKKKAETLIKKAEEDLFKVYAKDEDIKKFLRDFESLVDGNYTFDRSGEFCFYKELPKDLKDLPLIKEFITSNFGYFEDGNFYQFLGQPISILYTHDKNTFFLL